MPLQSARRDQGFSAFVAVRPLLFLDLEGRFVQFLDLLLFLGENCDESLSFRTKDLVTCDVNLTSFAQPCHDLKDVAVFGDMKIRLGQLLPIALIKFGDLRNAGVKAGYFLEQA